MTATPFEIDLILAAVRCWREARDIGQPIQPCLARALRGGDGPMLAPVFDSLLRFYEGALGRPVVAGSAARPSKDEQTLVSLWGGAASHACLDCPERAAKDLRCAICSARIMMALAQAPPPTPRPAFARSVRAPIAGHAPGR